jgi:ABC-2 type transport system ATP-binding protein
MGVRRRWAGRQLPAIEITNLVKKYGELVAVNGISLTVEDRQIFGILGPNGAGKTTTLEVVEGIRDPDEGTIKILGLDRSQSKKDIKQLIGVQLQSTATPDRLTVRETIELFGTFYEHQLPSDKVIEYVQLEQKADARVEELSGGQAQRLAIGLALVNDPKLVFLDEPTTGLDPAARRNLWEVIERLRKEGKTIVITTHYMEEAERLCDIVAIMDQGKIVAQDTPKNLIKALGESQAVKFTLVGKATDEELAALPGVTRVVSDDAARSLFTTNATQTLEAVFDATKQGTWKAEDLGIRSATLEDVFVKLTGRRLRD